MVDDRDRRRDTELTRNRRCGTMARVVAFLNEGHGRRSVAVATWVRR